MKNFHLILRCSWAGVLAGLVAWLVTSGAVVILTQFKPTQEREHLLPKLSAEEGPASERRQKPPSPGLLLKSELLDLARCLTIMLPAGAYIGLCFVATSTKTTQPTSNTGLSF